MEKEASRSPDTCISSPYKLSKPQIEVVKLLNDFTRSTSMYTFLIRPTKHNGLTYAILTFMANYRNYGQTFDQIIYYSTTKRHAKDRYETFLTLIRRNEPLVRKGGSDGDFIIEFDISSGEVGQDDTSYGEVGQEYTDRFAYKFRCIAQDTEPRGIGSNALCIYDSLYYSYTPERSYCKSIWIMRQDQLPKLTIDEKLDIIIENPLDVDNLDVDPE